MQRPVTAAIVAAAALILFSAPPPDATARPSPGVDSQAPSAKAVSPGDLRCLATAIYFEARGETPGGWRAVGRVILNRVASSYYPDTVCEVVYQGARRRNACQFSFACDGKPNVVKEQAVWQRIETAAETLLACQSDDDCHGHLSGSRLASATHYHADYVKPRWASKIERLGQIGRHIFYYTPTR